MAGKSDYLEEAMLNHLLTGVPYSGPGTLYVGLYTAAPTDTGGGTEVSASGYERTAVTFTTPVENAVSNDVDVQFPLALDSWGLITHFGIFDDQLAGNLLYWGALTNPRDVASGTVLTFAAGDLSVTED